MVAVRAGTPRLGVGRLTVGRAAALAGLLIGSGCTTLGAPEPARTTAASRPPVPVGAQLERSTAVDLLAAASSLLGAPYRPAGHDPSGFDCSGLVSYLFAAVGLELPRTAAGQSELGSWVALDELDAGDLVFFSSGSARPDHVGVVVSRPGEPLTMIHASSSRGVVETTITSSAYWLARLSFGRRILSRR